MVNHSVQRKSRQVSKVARVCIIDIANEAIQEFYDSRQLQAMLLPILFCQQFTVQHTFWLSNAFMRSAVVSLMIPASIAFKILLSLPSTSFNCDFMDAS